MPIVASNDPTISDINALKNSNLGRSALKSLPTVNDLPVSHHGLNQVITTDDKNRLWKNSGMSDEDLAHQARVEVIRHRLQLKRKDRRTSDNRVINTFSPGMVFGFLSVV